MKLQSWPEPATVEPVRNETIVAWLDEWVPSWAVVTLAIAIVVLMAGRPLAWIGFLAAGANLVLAAVVALFVFVHPRTLRTSEQLGFRNSWRHFAYLASWKGVPLHVPVLAGAAFALGIFAGMDTVTGWLSQSIVLLMAPYAALARKFPTDRRRGRRS